MSQPSSLRCEGRSLRSGRLWPAKLLSGQWFRVDQRGVLAGSPEVSEVQLAHQQESRRRERGGNAGLAEGEVWGRLGGDSSPTNLAADSRP